MKTLRQPKTREVRRDSGTRPRLESTPGYDAEEGPSESGLGTESIDLAEILGNAQTDGESLAVAPEDLGVRALKEAAQQDDSLELDPSLAEDDSSGEADLVDIDASDLDSPGESRMEPSAVDLTDSAIRNGSIFDQPRAGEMGQVRRPLLKTSEVDETLERNERARRASRAHRARK